MTFIEFLAMKQNIFYNQSNTVQIVYLGGRPSFDWKSIGKKRLEKPKWKNIGIYKIPWKYIHKGWLEGLAESPLSLYKYLSGRLALLFYPK